MMSYILGAGKTRGNGDSLQVDVWGSTEKMAMRLRRTEWLLEQQQTFAREERRLLENLVCIKDGDIEEHRQSLAASQRQAGRLTEELRECRSELLRRRREYDRVVADNIRLKAEKNEMQVIIAQLQYKKMEQEWPYVVKFEDTDL